MPASIEDVAKAANVSISTVSRAVNRRGLVNEETCKRVEAAIRELSYRPNAFARGLMLRKSGIVGLVLPDLHGEFYSEIIRGANSQAREMGHNLLLASALSGDDAENWVSAIGQLALLDGLALMVSDTMVAGIGPRLAQLSVPIVVLDDELEGVEHDAVIIDQEQGALDIMNHLLTDCGAERVIFVGGVKTNIDTQARHRAWKTALKNANIKTTAKDVYHLDYTYESAYRLAMEEIDSWRGPRCYVFCANDEMAAGIIAAATSKGVAVPKQLGVVGFDDTRVAQMIKPPLTTVRVPMSKMGATAIELLCQRIADPQRPPARVSLAAELVVRESCGCSAK